MEYTKLAYLLGVMVLVLITIPENVIGYAACKSSCRNVPDGDYASCKGCNVYVTCANGLKYDSRPCPANLVWDDKKKRCEYTSPTCAPTTDSTTTDTCINVCNGKCITHNLICNSKCDCSDCSDETGCIKQKPEDVCGAGTEPVTNEHGIAWCTRGGYGGYGLACTGPRAKCTFLDRSGFHGVCCRPEACKSSCRNVPDGDYASCKGCNVYVTCANGLKYDNRPCPANLVWDDKKKRCEYTSSNCTPTTYTTTTDPCIKVCNGKCITHNLICNSKCDCRDCSDETGCIQQEPKDVCGAGTEPVTNEHGIAWCTRGGYGGYGLACTGPRAKCTFLDRSGFHGVCCRPEACKSSCRNVPDGDYASCKGCNVYVTCANGLKYDNRPCPANLVWDDKKKRCEYTSSTCTIKPKPCCEKGNLTANLRGKRPVITGSLNGVTVASVETVPLYYARTCAHRVLITADFEKIDSNACFGCLNTPFCGRRMLKVHLQLSSGGRFGHLYNLGDSQSNNGFKGDAHHQINDAEIMGRVPHITVYGSDKCPNNTYLHQIVSGLGPAVHTVTMYVSNEYILITTDNGLTYQTCNDCLFALNGQPDEGQKGGPNERIYLGINRVVANISRSGYGVCSVTLNWVCPECPFA